VAVTLTEEEASRGFPTEAARRSTPLFVFFFPRQSTKALPEQPADKPSHPQKQPKEKIIAQRATKKKKTKKNNCWQLVTFTGQTRHSTKTEERSMNQRGVNS